MIILPYSTHLRLNRLPYVSLAIAVLCALIFYKQTSNESEIKAQLYQYCQELNLHSEAIAPDLDFLQQGSCVPKLYFFHERKYHGAFELLEEFNKKNELDLSESQKTKQRQILEQHLDDFRQRAPESFTGKLLYYPDELNPVRMFTSTIAHADFGHILFNLIFFLAFAPAIEVLIGRAISYLGILAGISVLSSLAYSLYSAVIAEYALPSLGLSGVVMGVIGLSAYLMPNAKIKTFVMYRTFLIPAWFVASWYLGWDIWTILSQETMGGVNLIAHISGGISGYLLGWYFLKERHAEIKRRTGS